MFQLFSCRGKYAWETPVSLLGSFALSSLLAYILQADVQEFAEANRGYMVLSRSMSYLAVQHLWSGILLSIDEQSAAKVFGLYKLDIYLVFLDGFLEEEGLSVGMRFQRVAIGYILKGSSPCNLKT